jgi:glycerol-3-phosphate acyltransferase PlsX
MGDVIRLAVDVQSGDFGPEAVVRGVVEARAASAVPFVAYMCGDGGEINRVLDGIEAGGALGVDRSDFIIEHCPDVITDAGHRTTVWRHKQSSSIVRCVALQKEGLAVASVSAGDTGVLFGSALFILGRAEGGVRPVLAAFIPTPVKPVLVADVGANVNCRAEHLAGFAELGRAYVSRIIEKRDVKVALLNIGTEPGKGPRVVREAAELLEGSAGYAGFIEGDRVFSGDADVVVCDGFTGNTLLKACESFYTLTYGFLADNREAMEMLTQRIEALNSENYGAVPFLGINGTVLKAHGRSSARSIKSAVLTAIKAVSGG